MLPTLYPSHFSLGKQSSYYGRHFDSLNLYLKLIWGTSSIFVGLEFLNLNCFHIFYLSLLSDSLNITWEPNVPLYVYPFHSAPHAMSKMSCQKSFAVEQIYLFSLLFITASYRLLFRKHRHPQYLQGIHSCKTIDKRELYILP